MKNKGGRPKKEFDKILFEDLCGIMCTQQEICDIFRTTTDTLTRWCKDTYGTGFSQIYKTLSATGKQSLRRAQFRLAEKNAAMAIFLGKNYLGQRDQHDIVSDEALEKLDTMLSNINKIADD